MALPRDLRKLICRLLIGILVFAQLAVSAYACPASRESSTTAELAAVQADCIGPHDSAPVGMALDEEFANLCVEHCRFGQQGTDASAMPQVQGAAPALLYTLSVHAEPMSHAHPARAGRAPVQAAPPPPHAILHCVLRI